MYHRMIKRFDNPKTPDCCFEDNLKLYFTQFLLLRLDSIHLKLYQIFRKKYKAVSVKSEKKVRKFHKYGKAQTFSLKQYFSLDPLDLFLSAFFPLIYSPILASKERILILDTVERKITLQEELFRINIFRVCF